MKTFQDTRNAENKSIGFDYQYYYFLYKLLGLEEGEKIGIEVKDDVHLDYGNGEQDLIQLKHSIQTNSSGKTVNLTERDIDLWKTIYNWINIINDPFDGRKTSKEQLSFIDRTKFILVSNKSSSLNNTFLKRITEFKQQKITIKDVKKYLDDLEKKTVDKDVKSYIEILNKQSEKWLSRFINKLVFELDQDDLINKIKSRIKSKIVREEKIDDVFNALDSNLRKQNYINTKSKKKSIITFEEFYHKYKAYFDKGRNNKLPINKKKIKFNKPLLEQMFIKQLIDICAVDETDTAEMLRLTGQMLQTSNHLEDWINKGLIVEEQLDEFVKDCINKWKNTHDAVHRKINLNLKLSGKYPSEEEIILSGSECLDKIRDLELVLDETNLDTELSNGEFYILSNELRIGWRYDWKERYKK
jgi:DNA-binding transcriptional MerR regulator